MPQVTINGRSVMARSGSTLLAACRDASIDLPTLCHDDRLKPAGACRLCLVRVAGQHQLVPACATLAAEGMNVETHTPEIEETRRVILSMLAANYPAEAVARWPDKLFHRWLEVYGINQPARPSHLSAGEVPRPEREGLEASPSPDGPTLPFLDNSHPYLAADMTRCIDCFRCVRICNEVQGNSVWHVTGPGRRSQIRPDGPTLLASSCTSCGACADTCPTGALEDQSVLQFGTPTQWTRTTCPYCGVGCEMNVGTRGGRILQIKPALDAPVNKGHLCVKGRYAFDFTHAQDRVSEPMIRDGNGWRPVSWPAAIRLVAERLGHIRDSAGADSIGVLGSARGTNEENYLVQKFARVVLGTNNVDCCARVCHAPTAAGMKQTLGTGAATNSFDDIEHAAAFLICGCNPTENHPIVGARIKQAVLRGAKLVVIDPRKIELSLHSTLHLQLRPGTNVPLLNALTQVIVTENLIDAKTLRDRVADFPAFRDFIREWTPERASAITGVSASLIRKAAHVLGTQRPTMSFHGLGVTEHGQGTEAVMCLVNLALLTGNLGVPGGGVNPLRGQNNVQGAAHMGCEPHNLTGYVPIDEARDDFEATWQTPIPRGPGLNLMQMIDAAEGGRLKALWGIGYDVALTNPDRARTKAALAQIELVIVQDLFMNELAREFAHVFLPACSSFEKDGTFMNSERRVQRIRQAIPPWPNSKPDWEIICDLAKAMGCAEQFNFSSPEEIWDEVRSLWKAGAGMSYSRLDAGGLQWPCPTEEHPGTAILHTQEFPHGARASLTRVEFHATTETVTEEYPLLLTTGRTLYQFNAGTMTMRTPNEQLRRTDTLDLSPADARQFDLKDGDKAHLRSRHGEAVLPVHIDSRLRPGELFATFHVAGISLNNLTSSLRDRITSTPEYKVVAVSLARAEPKNPLPGCSP